MSATATSLQLGMFAAQFSKPVVTLPRATFATREQLTSFLKSLAPHIQAHPEQADDAGQYHVYLLNGDHDQERVSATLTSAKYLWRTLILAGLHRYFRERGFRVQKDKFGVRILDPNPALQSGMAVVRRGVRIQARRPFAEAPDLYFISASWVTPAEFVASLEDDTMRAMSLGNSVILRPAGADTPPELRKYKNKYLGVVKEIAGAKEAVIYCADHSLRLVPARDLVLEAKPQTLAEYARRSSKSGTSFWVEHLKLNFTLNANGRRNIAVLRDRLTAIQRFLANGNSRALVLSPTTLDELTIQIDLKPLTIRIEPDV